MPYLGSKRRGLCPYFRGWQCLTLLNIALSVVRSILDTLGKERPRDTHTHTHVTCDNPVSARQVSYVRDTRVRVQRMERGLFRENLGRKNQPRLT
ncbi:hypothetical protein B0H67DRAFT_591990, partial [Lasiosphaeris hirsuta]